METIKDKIINFFLTHTNCEAIVIFGSYARNTQTNESDIDIAIKSQPPLTKKEIFNLSNLLSDILNKDIDLVDLDTIENDGFKYEILINGTTIYTKNSYSFDMYKLDAFREYLELNESRKAIIDDIKKMY